MTWLDESGEDQLKRQLIAIAQSIQREASELIKSVKDKFTKDWAQMASKYRIESLEIEGFKAFTNKCEIKLDSKPTFIFGENGKGKSSIIEAIIKLHLTNIEPMQIIACAK